jgi:hypothetical protein
MTNGLPAVASVSPWHKRILPLAASEAAAKDTESIGAACSPFAQGLRDAEADNATPQPGEEEAPFFQRATRISVLRLSVMPNARKRCRDRAAQKSEQDGVAGAIVQRVDGFIQDRAQMFNQFRM